MQSDHAPHNLSQLLDALLAADPDTGDVSVSELMEAVGKRSFGPLLLLVSIIAFTPLGGIPGVPTVLAAIVIIIVSQLVFGRQRFWLPQFVQRREIDSGGLRKAIGWVQPVARRVDVLIKPRLVWLLRGIFLRVGALGCVAMALTVPPLEIVPFGGTVSWAAIGMFGLAVVAEDGVLALVALAFAIGAVYVVATALL